MKQLIVLAFSSCLIATAAAAAEPAGSFSRVIFADDFSSNAFGPRWTHYKSGSVVKDGILVGITPVGSDHSAVDIVRFPAERDLEVAVKFRFVSDKAKSFNVWFDDRDFKGSHAGHICNVNVSPTAVNIGDAKTGNFRNDIYAKKKATPSTLTAEDKAMLATKNSKLTVQLALQEWHALVIRTQGDSLEVSLDGKVAGSFKSEGIAHDHKTIVSLTTNPVDVHYDDFSIKGTGAAVANP
ncbi:hypothetical protein LBMAG56_33050 [Verrucomicrobiota bacterium]|nr:hypothetical protein LBMAG56_33050 [Verrucomicrobiota bacterium]